MAGVGGIGSPDCQSGTDDHLHRSALAGSGDAPTTEQRSILNSFIPVFIACLTGALLGYVVRLGVKAIRPRRAGGAGPARGATPDGADRFTDLISIAAGVAAIIVVCSTGTPAVWEVAFIFAYFWPVLLHLLLRSAGPPVA